MGYHIKEIEPGVLGEKSKIREELEEFIDALDQDCSIMALVELSDIIGAIKSYLEQYHPTVTVDDLMKMASITQRAFEDGTRKPRN